MRTNVSVHECACPSTSAHVRPRVRTSVHECATHRRDLWQTSSPDLLWARRPRDAEGRRAGADAPPSPTTTTTNPLSHEGGAGCQ